MLFNFYTYLYYGALAAGAAGALFVRTVWRKKNHKFWTISSSYIVLWLILSIIVVFTGLIVCDPQGLDPINALIFLLIVLFISIFSSIFFRFPSMFILSSIPLVLFVYFHNDLESRQFSNKNILYELRILKESENQRVLELKDHLGSLSYYEVQKGELNISFDSIIVPPFYFFLNGTYFRFNGINSSEIKEINYPPLLPQIIKGRVFKNGLSLDSFTAYLIGISGGRESVITMDKI